MAHPGFVTRPSVLGLLGGGQLGYMLIESANRLGIDVVVLDPNPSCPCSRIAKKFIQGDFKCPDQIERLITEGGASILTVEIEHVSDEGLEKCKSKYGVQISPSYDTIRIIQNKYFQKEFLMNLDIPVVPFRAISSYEGLIEVIMDFGLPVVLKTRRLAYDGRGNYVINTIEEIEKAISFFQLGNLLSDGDNVYQSLYVEKFVNYIMEISVMIGRPKKVRDKMVVTVNQGEEECVVFPLVQAVHSKSVLRMVKCPVKELSEKVKERAIEIAKMAVMSFPCAISSDGKYDENCGIFCVEMFVVNRIALEGNEYDIYVNEIAPRPHNSGHFTIESCQKSQYDVHLRCIYGLKNSNITLNYHSIMLNIFGLGDENCEKVREFVEFCDAIQCAQVHWYFKSEQFRGRKIGHVTFLGDSFDEIFIQIKSQPNYADMKVVMDSVVGVDVEEMFNKYSLSCTPFLCGDNDLLEMFDVNEVRQPQVAIIMGSDSDLSKMKSAAMTLEQFHVKFLLTIISAHRTPLRLYKFASNAHRFGIKVIIAGAGGAAHLPGMVASLTPLPVIGVPIEIQPLKGIDSLLSIIQMPQGIPVATVAINNSTNAALLAVKILSTTKHSTFLEEIIHHQKLLEYNVMQKVKNLKQKGWKNY